jgi:long-chain acyl-CoA synthetase
MSGYWHNDEATANTIRDGWLHTGDIGAFDDEGYLKITDRKKDLIVLSGGDNVSPARVESYLTLEPEIAQAMVYGDKHPALVALLVPDPQFLRHWAQANGKSRLLADVAQDPDLIKALGPAVERVNKKLANLEKIRRFAVADEAFTIENEEFTPTMKIRRHKIAARYGDRFERLYVKG